MSEIVIRIPGQPQGKGRARSFIRLTGPRAGKIGHITPDKTRTYESLIQGHAIQVMGWAPPLECPVILDMVALFDVPLSWPAWKRAMALAGEIAPTTKPDMDNIKKAVKDALNGVVWRDDCYVTLGTESKQYAAVAGVILTIRPTGQYPAQIKVNPNREKINEKASSSIDGVRAGLGGRIGPERSAP